MASNSIVQGNRSVGALLDVQGLETRFYTRDGIVKAVNGISYTMDKGEIIAIVGESGCGKSVSVLSILRLIREPPAKITSGRAFFMGRDLLKLDKDKIRKIRGKEIAIVPQDPMVSLNPVLTIERQLTETLVLHMAMDRKAARNRAIELLKMVDIPGADSRINDYPHQFSGGMRQRAMIAMALSCEPQILIADEPTTALDVTIQAQIVDLVKRLGQELGMAIIWITHDLGVVASLAQRVVVMYSGFIVEEALVHDLYSKPSHPYTIGLLQSLPRIDVLPNKRLTSIEGMPPDMIALPAGCPFAPRCSLAEDRCWNENPAIAEIAPGHRVACWTDVNTGSKR